jgi:phage terminase large subunit-like protein
VRARIVEWLKSVWFLRAEPAYIDAGSGALQRNLSAQVIVLTRWDHEDLVGWLLAQELGDAPQHWHVLDLPAIAEHLSERPAYPPTVTLEPDWRQPGEALCPERFPLQELLKIRSRTGAFWWSALYQQRPSPATGGIFQRSWIRPPFPRQQRRRYAPLILSCDLTFKDEDDSCYCGFELLGLLAAEAGKSQKLEIEVLWAVRKRLGLPGTIHFLLSASAALQQQGLRPHAVLVEDAANGPAVLQMLRRRIRGLLPVPPRGSKELRAHAVAPLLEAGQVAFHHRAEPLTEELPRFPKGSKDLTDAFCHGALWLEERYWKALGQAEAPVPLLLSR